MAVYTSLLGLALPTTGTLFSTWGDTVNNAITALTDSAIAGTTTLSADSDVTLTATDGAANQARSAVLLWTATNGANTRSITAPSHSKAYIVINAGTGSVIVKGAATTGVTIATGIKALIAWNGTDFVRVSSSAVALADITGLGTGVATALAIAIGSAGAVVANGGALGTPSSGTATNITGLPISTGVSGLGANVATFLATPSSANLATAITDETGSGSLVFATSPSLVTPLLGTPTSGALTNCTSDGTNGVGYKNIPQNSQSADYTLVLLDSGKNIFHPATDAADRVFTIPANGSVAYPLGTAISFINMSANALTIAITSDTLYTTLTGSTGSHILAQYGSATIIKMTSTTWMITGSGIT